MNTKHAALIFLIGTVVCAQETYRKPSPFPEKNLEREAAAKASQVSRPADADSAKPARTRPQSAPDEGFANREAPSEGQTGTACFFSPKGPRTASGEEAKSDELVAAHAAYPFGTRVKVTNLANGEAVVVRIVDRISDSRRIISVSEAAARELGFLRAGTAEVTLEPIAPAKAPKEK